MIDIRREELRVRYQCQRAEKEDVSATLSLSEWLAILNHFEYKCAYCGGKFEVMEHIISIANGGGTVAQNIVPACQYCNIVKDRFKFTNIVSQETISKAREKLAQLLKIDIPESITSISPVVYPQVEQIDIQPEPHLPQYFDLDEVAKMSGSSVNILKKYLSNNELKGIKTGKKWRFTQQDIDDFIKLLREKTYEAA